MTNKLLTGFRTGILVQVVSFLAGVTVALAIAFHVATPHAAINIPAVDAQTLQGATPTLTADQKNKAIALATSDGRSKSLLSNVSTTSGDPLVWTTERGILIGAVVSFNLPAPATLTGTWVDLDYDCSERSTPPYGAVPFHATYSNVRSLLAFVDLIEGRVAA